MCIPYAVGTEFTERSELEAGVTLDTPACLVRLTVDMSGSNVGRVRLVNVPSYVLSLGKSP